MRDESAPPSSSLTKSSVPVPGDQSSRLGVGASGGRLHRHGVYAGAGVSHPLDHGRQPQLRLRRARAFVCTSRAGESALQLGPEVLRDQAEPAARVLEQRGRARRSHVVQQLFRVAAGQEEEQAL